MVVKRWTDERLDQLADDVDSLRTSVADLRATAEIMLQTQLQHQRNFEVSQRNFETIQRSIETMQGEIRGLQLENRRMLEELRGRRDDEDM